MVICGNSPSDRRQIYMRKIEKVRFGVPPAEAFSHDIPATLLILLLKVNKEGIHKKDIWRAPGNQAQVRKLIHVMQHGRLVNIANFSVYTAASVIKKFLAKLPSGIFGPENERRLFDILDIPEPEKRREAVCRVIQSLPVPSQHLLVLLFGTFRMVSDASSKYGTRMSPEAIGVCVAPSLFHTCIHNGNIAHLDDVVRFRVASQIVTFVVNNFGHTNLFPRDNYEYYARMTGRTLCMDNHNWTFVFRSDCMFSHDGDECSSEWLPHDASTSYGLRMGLSGAVSHPDIVVSPGVESDVGSLIHEQSRLTSSLDEPTTAVSLDELRKNNHFADSTRSLSYLGDEMVRRQLRRMQARSEWFLSPALPPKLEEFKSLEVLLNSASTEGSSQDLNSQALTMNSKNSCHSSPLPLPIQRRKSWRTHYSRGYKTSSSSAAAALYSNSIESSSVVDPAYDQGLRKHTLSKIDSSSLEFTQSGHNTADMSVDSSASVEQDTDRTLRTEDDEVVSVSEERAGRQQRFFSLPTKENSAAAAEGGNSNCSNLTGFDAKQHDRSELPNEKSPLLGSKAADLSQSSNSIGGQRRTFHF